MIRDIQHRFNADGRDYVIEVCAPGKNPAPVSAGPFDVHIAAAAPSNFADTDVEAPEKVAAGIIQSVQALVPKAIAGREWGDFAGAVCNWICSHRRAALIEEWNLEHQELEYGPTYERFEA